MFKGPNPSEIKNWVCVMERGTEYEIQLARGYLSNLEIPSNILSKRDSAYSLTVGEMALVYLYVPKEFEKRARRALEEFNDTESDTNEDWDDGEL